MRFEALVIDHFPYAWAAYKQGAFEGADEFPPNLTAKEFENAFADLMESFLGNSLSEVLVVFAETSNGVIPVCIITIEYNGRLALPHAYWFPWATARNRIEVAVKFFIQLKKNNLVLVTVKDENDVKFFRHLCKYGLLRVVGKIRDWYDDGSATTLFQSVGS